MAALRSVCVYCGSRFGGRPTYRALAEAFGSALAAGGLELVYGGGAVGLMGVVADAVLEAPASVDAHALAASLEQLAGELMVDLDLELSVGAPLGPVQLQGILMLSYLAVDDSWPRSATNVTEDAGFLVGFGLGISGGRR